MSNLHREQAQQSPDPAVYAEPGEVDGIGIESLEAGDVLIVRTRNSTYRLEVLDPARRDVLLSGGAYFARPTEVRLGGATEGGGTLKVGWIGVGLQLEIASGHQRTTTSCVESVTVEHAQAG
jgi:hypothetical protein